MFKSLYSKILTAYLAMVIGVLAVLGVMASGIFRSHYIEETKSELIRESNAINKILLEEYIDMERFPVAREKLYAIARQYGALIQLRFDSEEITGGNILGMEYYDTWKNIIESDLTGITEMMRNGTNFYNMVFDIDGIVNAHSEEENIRTLTLIRPIQTGDGKRMGMMLFHYDMTAIYETLDRLYLDVFVSAVVSVLIIVPVAFIISKYITKPVSDIDSAVKDFSRGKYESRVEISGRDEISRLAESFNAMAGEVAGLEKARRDFVANVSHELRSPLTSIIGFLEAMEDGAIQQEEHHKYIGVVLDESRRMSAIVRDLLDIAKIESGQYKLNYSSFDVNELIGRVLLAFEGRILQKELDLDVRLGDEPIYVNADRDRIGQVLHNLIDNAIKYSGGVIGIESTVVKHTVYVSVRDNGIGIPKEDIAHIFDRFYKVEKAHTYASGSGTGLGLSIAKIIIDQHDCEISVKSDENGTDFTFTLNQSTQTRRG